MGWLFNALFKYPAYVFRQGDFTFATSRTSMTVLALVGAVAAASLITYRGIKGPGHVRERAVLVALRLALLALLLFCLFRPSLILRAAVPQQNFLGVLIDDSRSMTIADSAEKPRTDFVGADALGSAAGLENQAVFLIPDRADGTNGSVGHCVHNAHDAACDPETSCSGQTEHREGFGAAGGNDCDHQQPGDAAEFPRCQQCLQDGPGPRDGVAVLMGEMLRGLSPRIPLDSFRVGRETTLAAS